MFGRRGCPRVQSDGIVCWVDWQYIQTAGKVGRRGCWHIQTRGMVWRGVYQYIQSDGIFEKRGCPRFQSDGMVGRSVCQYIQTDGMFGRIDCRISRGAVYGFPQPHRGCTFDSAGLASAVSLPCGEVWW